MAVGISKLVLLAEIVHHYFPTLVELHNYSNASGKSQKLYNWTTLNTKVFKKMGFTLHKSDVDAVIAAETEAIERVLKLVKDIVSFNKEDYGS